MGLVGGRAHGAAEDKATLCASVVRSVNERADGKRHRRDSRDVQQSETGSACSLTVVAVDGEFWVSISSER